MLMMIRSVFVDQISTSVIRHHRAAVVSTAHTARLLSVPLPPRTEQYRIVAKVDELMTLCDRLWTSLTTGADTHRRLLDALLHEVLEPDGSYPEMVS